MTQRTLWHGLKVSAWDAYFPLGDKAAFQAWDINKNLSELYKDEEGSLAELSVMRIPDFDIRQQLGRKGTRNFDRHTGLFVKTVGNLIESVGNPDISEYALINCTATGSLASILDFTLDTFRCEKPYFVNPAHFPNVVINCAAGQAAIRYQVKGPNMTLSGGDQSFYHGLKMANRLSQSNRAKNFIVGAVEDVEPEIAALWKEHNRVNGSHRVLLETTGSMLLEAAELNAQDDFVLGVEVGCAPHMHHIHESMQHHLQRLLSHNGVAAEHIAYLSVHFDQSLSGDYFDVQMTQDLFPQAQVTNFIQQYGDGHSCNGLVQSLLLFKSLKPSQVGIQLSISKDGAIACSLLKKGES